MPQNKKILFPIDFSDGTRQIVPYVIEIADKFQSEVHVLHVVHVSPYYEGVGMANAYVAEFEDAVVKQAQIRMDDFINRTFPARQAVGKVVTGYPGKAILEYADKEKTELIVMGHSKKGLERMFLGSVAGYVVKKSPVPVMIVNPDAAAAVFQAD